MPDVSADLTVSFESLLSVAASAAVPHEGVGWVFAPNVIDHEAEGQVSSAQIISIEELGPVSAAAQISFESLLSVSGPAAIPIESLLPVSRDFPIWFEPKTGGTDQGIGASAPLGVLPEIGSAIYTFWAARRNRESQVYQYLDKHMTGRLLYDRTRLAWDLKMEVGASVRDEIWDFILDHYGLGKSFYFYDLQNNGFVWDETGETETGRYLVRFDEETFPQEYRVGERFAFEFSIIEIE